MVYKLTVNLKKNTLKQIITEDTVKDCIRIINRLSNILDLCCDYEIEM